MKFKEFSKKYRQFVENRKIAIPGDLWESIAGELDNDEVSGFHNKIRKSSDNFNYNKEEIDDVWQKLSFELDIDEVWNGLDKELTKDKRKKTPFIWSIYISAAASILILFILWFTIKDYNRSDLEKNKALVKKNEAVKNNKQKRTVDTVNARTTYITDAKANSVIKNILPIIKLNKPKVKDSQNDIEIPNEKLMAINSVPTLLTGIESSIPNMIEVKEQNADLLDIRKNRKINLENWSLGLNIAAKNTWMYNQKTVNGLQSSYMNTSKAKVIPDIGIFLTYNAMQKWSFTGSFYHRSRIDQSYDEYIYGIYENHEYQLSYTTFEFISKYRNNKNFFFGNKLKRRSVGGLYYAYLSSAEEIVSSEKNEIGSSFKQADYGLVLGQDWQYSHNRIMVNLGIYMKYGLPSISSNSSEYVSGFNNTHNISFEFRIGFELGLQKK